MIDDILYTLQAAAESEFSARVRPSECRELVDYIEALEERAIFMAARLAGLMLADEATLD